MRLILAIFRPEKLPDVKAELMKADVHMMTVLDVKGRGRQKGFIEEYRGVVEEMDLYRKVMLLIAVNESFVEKTVDAITKSARVNGGDVGDGKIFVLPLEECIRISSGEKGPIAIGGESPEMKKAKK